MRISKISTLFLISLALPCAAQNLIPVIIVARVDLAAKANQSAKLIDVLHGEDTFTVPLTRNGVDTAAFWCSWMMTGADAIQIRSYLANKCGYSFTNPATGKWVAKSGTQVVLAAYDGRTWGADAVLTDLNLQVFNRQIP